MLPPPRQVQRPQRTERTGMGNRNNGNAKRGPDVVDVMACDLRLELLLAMAGKVPRCVGELNVAVGDVGSDLVSYHLRQLREAGLVEFAKREAQKRFYTVTDRVRRGRGGNIVIRDGDGNAVTLDADWISRKAG